MCDASGTPAPSYAELEGRLAAAVAAREEAERNPGAVWHAWRKRVERVFDAFSNEVMPIAHVEGHRENPEVVLPYLEAWFGRLAETEAKLYAAEARAAEAEADVARLERLHAACDATIQGLTAKALAALRGQEAAEARAERLEGAARLRLAEIPHHDKDGCKRIGCGDCALRAALAEEGRR